MLTCFPYGCTPTVCWAKGFMAFLPVLRSPACSGFASPCRFSSPIWFTTFAMGSPLWGRGSFVLNRKEGLVCCSFPFGLFLHFVTALRVLVAIWVRCVGWFPLMRDRRLLWVLRNFSFWMGFDPLSETPLSALSLRGGFLVVLAEDESLRLSLALSSVLPCLSGSCVGGEGHGRLVYQIYLVYRELCLLAQYTCPIVLPLISGL